MAQEPSEDKKTALVQERLDQLTGKLWWNQDKKIELLSLTEEQRSQMNKSLETYIATRRALALNSSAFQNFSEALANRDRKKAEMLSREVVESMAKPLQAQLEIMIDVAEILSPEQTRILLDKYPRFFSRTWIQNERLQFSQRSPTSARSNRKP